MTREEKEQKKLLVLGMHANNSSNAEICKALDVSESFVLAVYKEKGLKSNRKANVRITDDRKAKAIELVENGMSFSKAGRILEISPSSIATICREHFASIQPENNPSNDSREETAGIMSPISPISQIIEGIEMMLEGFKRLE